MEKEEIVFIVEGGSLRRLYGKGNGNGNGKTICISLKYGLT
jgi:hypothetical protein